MTTHDYVQRLQALYRRIPGTSGFARRAIAAWPPLFTSAAYRSTSSRPLF